MLSSLRGTFHSPRSCCNNTLVTICHHHHPNHHHHQHQPDHHGNHGHHDHLGENLLAHAKAPAPRRATPPVATAAMLRNQGHDIGQECSCCAEMEVMVLVGFSWLWLWLWLVLSVSPRAILLQLVRQHCSLSICSNFGGVRQNWKQIEITIWLRDEFICLQLVAEKRSIRNLAVRDYTTKRANQGRLQDCAV